MREIREALKVLSWASNKLISRQSWGVAILMYHRVTGDSGLELDVNTDDFEAQMCWLARHGRVVSLDEVLSDGAKSMDLRGEAPVFVLTFDDAYRDFYTRAWPVVRDLGLPATLYVPTGFVEEPGRAPTSRCAAGGAALAPVTWPMLEELVESPVITIGAHTHSHFELPSLSNERVEEELSRCDDLLRERLDVRVEHFAYPRGVWDARVEQFVRRRYRSAVHVGGGLVDLSGWDQYRLPRIPVQGSDRMRWFESRIKGDLRYEESAVGILKRLRARGRGLRRTVH